MKFSIKDFLSKCNQIRSFLRLWSHLLKKSLMENFIFCAVFRRCLTNTVMSVTNLSVLFLIASSNHFHNAAHQTRRSLAVHKFNMYFLDLTWDCDEENN